MNNIQKCLKISKVLSLLKPTTVNSRSDERGCFTLTQKCDLELIHMSRYQFPLVFRTVVVSHSAGCDLTVVLMEVCRSL